MNIQKTEIEKEKFKVLLVCDNPRMLKNIVCILEEKGCDVKTVSSGCEAIDLVCKNPFDVVLTDLLMSPKERNTILKKSKELNPETIVILLGSGEDIQYDHDTLSFEADDYVRNEDGSIKLFTLPNHDYSYICDDIDVHNLQERDEGDDYDG